MNRTAANLGMLLCTLASASVSFASDEQGDYERALADHRQAYEERLSALEAEVRQLRGEGAAVSARGEPAAPQLELRGFGHLQFDASHSTPRGVGSRDSGSHFTNGGMDLFITSAISDDVSFLNETVFEFGPDGENILDVERLQLRYNLANWISVAAGRGHTALGYWNQQFHHGTWLQTTADRPLLYAFEDDGGILPVHFVGLEALGEIPIGAGSLSYAINVANGRGAVPDSVQLIGDRNDSKMLGLLISLHPIERMGIGFNVLSDRIPGDASIDPSRARSIDELVYGAHFFWLADPVELIAEAQWIHHGDHASGTDFLHYGGYLQVGYSLGSFKPYYRVDLLGIEAGDPFFFDFGQGVPLVEDTLRHAMGLRWDILPFLALKGEWRLRRATSERANEGIVQASFAF